MWEVLLRGGGRTSGRLFLLDGGVEAELVEAHGRGAALVRFRGRGGGGLLAHADRAGVIPLPPYIEAARKRTGDGGEDDRVRYQTVYAREPGAVAAPTAGLHFTETLLRSVEDAGHELARVTLHVGPGTFRPVEVEDPRAHQMDVEHYEVPLETAQAIARARAENRPIVAVGTTVVRTLETAGRSGVVEAGRGETQLFLLPGSRFHVVTDLVTNFHLPRSTLLMLVAAFAGQERVMAAYREAVSTGYRFYSYGDAMLITSGGATGATS